MSRKLDLLAQQWIEKDEIAVHLRLDRERPDTIHRQDMSRLCRSNPVVSRFVSHHCAAIALTTTPRPEMEPGSVEPYSPIFTVLLLMVLMAEAKDQRGRDALSHVSYGRSKAKRPRQYPR